MIQAQGGPTIGQLVVIMVGSIPVLGIIAWAGVKIFGPIGQAVARRIGGSGSMSDTLEHRVASLADDLDQVRAQLAETHERLDFAERMLAQGRQPEQLPRS